MTPECTLLRINSTQMGYGRAGVKLAEAVQRAGVEVYDKYDSISVPPPGTPAELLELGLDPRTKATGTRAKHTNVLCWVGVPGNTRGWWTGQHVGMFTMWEADQLPEGFRDTLHEFDTMLVPSSQNVELFRQHHNNVHYVPLGVDPMEWQFRSRRVDNEFRFLIGGSGPRKGTDLAFDAFRAVFGARYDGSRWRGDGPAPRLVMKQPQPERQFGAPWMDLISGRISGEEERDLYASAHCYVQPARGEGFGLQPLQAIAQGLPTILTDAHGHADYAHLGIPLSASMSPAGYFAVGNAPDMQWWEPDFDELCELMFDVYSDYESYCGRAEWSARLVAEQWTWDQSAQAFIAAFGDELTRSAPLRDQWHNPVARRYLVRINRRWAADIGDRSLIFELGHDYYESADVKRILFESNLLDPSCLDGDTGLSPEQLDRIPHYQAENAYCPTCHQQLNTVPTKADELAMM